MKVSRTILLLLVVLGMGAYIWFYEINQLSTAEELALQRQAFDLQVEQIHGIGIQTSDYAVDLFKTDQGWELIHPKGARAAAPVVQQLLARFKTLGKGDLITPADMRENEKSLAEYGLAVPRIKLTLTTPGQTREYQVGDVNPLGNSVYVKEESTQNVIPVSTDLLEILPIDVLAYRDKTLFPLHEEEVQAVDLIGEDRMLRLEKREGEWVLKTPVSSLADQEQVLALIQKLLQSRIEGVVNDPGTQDMENFERSEDVIRLWPVNSKVPVELVVGGDLPMNPDQLLVRISGQEGLVKVSKGMRMLAQSPVELFRDRRLFNVDPQSIVRISIQQGGGRLVLEKKGIDWQVVDPVTMKASSARVQNMMKTWMEAQVENFVEDDPELQALKEVSFTPEEADGEKPVTFEIVENLGLPGRALLRKSGEQGLLQVVPDLVKYAPVNVLPYLSREVLTYNPLEVVRLSLSHGERTQAVIRTGPDQPWTAQEETGDVDQERVSEIIRTFSKVFAENLVELNPLDLVQYGLENPPIRLSVGLAGEQAGNRTLWLSRPEENGPVMAILQGQNLVFQMSQEDFQMVVEPLFAGE